VSQGHERGARGAGRLLRAALLAAALAAAGCAGRTPEAARELIAAPAGGAEPAVAAASARLAAMVGAHEAERLSVRTDAAGRGPRSALLRAALERAEARDGGRLAPVAAPPGEHRFERRWRGAEAWVALDAAPPRGAPELRFPGVQAAETVLRLASVADRALSVRGRCDGPVRLWQGDDSRPGAGADRPFALRLAPGVPDGTRLVLGAGVARCELEVGPEDLARRHRLTLLRDEVADPGLAALDSRLDVCAVPPAAGLDPLERAFHADRWLSRTCATVAAPARLLPEATEAFNAKVEALTGQPLDPVALAAGDPEMALDFSHAPRLELILLSYLQLRADFSGRLILRMVEHHAARGTAVRILVSDNLITGKDRAMLMRLAAAHPSVQVQSYRWRPPEGMGPATLPERLNRGNHTKAFLTLAAEPGRSRMITGGRNLHDGFLFDTPRDLSAHPELHDYTRRLRAPLAYFAAYEDLEVEVADDVAVRAMAAHMATLWHRDAASSVVRPFSVATEVAGAPRGGMLHFLSVPQADGQALERWFVELIGAAETRIDIASPYLNLTAELSAALKAASDRGVRIRLLTPELPATDPLSGFKTGFIEASLRRLGPRVEAWQIALPDRLLHAKLLVFDERLGIVTSANMNARSFVLDTENGIAALDAAFAGRLTRLFEGWLAAAEPIGRVAPPSGLVRLLLRSPRLRSWF